MAAAVAIEGSMSTVVAQAVDTGSEMRRIVVMNGFRLTEQK